MPRPKKCRRVCDLPENRVFAPLGNHRNRIISLSIDEYETIRLIDKKGFSQEQCGEQMDISRTTVQLLYASARKKLADALVDGAMLQIEGGDYRLCNGEAHCLNCQTCLKYQLNQQYQKSKGDTIMRIAVTFEDGQIFQHFGRTEQFKVYDAEDGKVISSEVVSTNGQGHGALAGVLRALNADILICGGIGGGAQAALAANGIKLCGGVSGDADQAVEAFLAGSLRYDPEVHCDHHGHGDHEHHCGSHGCGNHGSCHE
ncbi:MAG: DUF134 domain-containing protein [Clostridiaceae bacterium]|nr:DUF134 domain-containing protein [Clostridiaceae bacterium]